MPITLASVSFARGLTSTHEETLEKGNSKMACCGFVLRDNYILSINMQICF